MKNSVKIDSRKQNFAILFDIVTYLFIMFGPILDRFASQITQQMLYFVSGSGFEERGSFP